MSANSEYQLKVAVPEGFSGAPTPPPFMIGVKCDDHVVTEVAYLEEDAGELAPQNKLAEEAFTQLLAYFTNPHHKFLLNKLPLAPAGSLINREMREALMALPAGEIITYAQLAEKMGRKGNDNAQAVASACVNNRMALIVPCYRVLHNEAIDKLSVPSKCGINWSRVFVEGDKGEYFAKEGGDPKWGRAVRNWLLQYEGVRVG